MPNDVTEALLGSASLSFYASRVVFCEGDSTSLDAQLDQAWFPGPDTVVRAVGDSQRVIRCVDAVANSGIASALAAVGLVDGDTHPDAYKSALPAGVLVLDVHEVESLLCLPELLSAVCPHVAQPFDESAYRAALVGSVSEENKHQMIIERWKARIEPHLQGLVADISKRQLPVDDLIADLPNVFNQTSWTFSPEEFLKEERVRVESAVPDGPLSDILAVVPGKQLLPVAARSAGLNVQTYVQLVVDALRSESEELKALGAKLEAALTNHLPPRYAPVKVVSVAP